MIKLFRQQNPEPNIGNDWRKPNKSFSRCVKDLQQLISEDNGENLSILSDKQQQADAPSGPN
jgi:hypothetical protein